MPFTLRNVKEDLEDLGSRFDGAPDLEFRMATQALELEKSGLREELRNTPIGRFAKASGTDVPGTWRRSRG